MSRRQSDRSLDKEGYDSQGFTLLFGPLFLPVSQNSLGNWRNQDLNQHDSRAYAMSPRYTLMVTVLIITMDSDTNKKVDRRRIWVPITFHLPVLESVPREEYDHSSSNSDSFKYVGEPNRSELTFKIGPNLS